MCNRFNDKKIQQKIKYSQNFRGNSIYTNVNYLKFNDDCEASSNLNKQQQQAICKVTESQPQTTAAQGSSPFIIKLANNSTNNNNNQVVATTTATTGPTGGKRQSVCFSDDILGSSNMNGKLTSPPVSSEVTTSQRNLGEDDKLEKGYLSGTDQLSPTNGNNKLLTPYLSGNQLTGSFISSNSAVTNSSLGLNTSLRANKSMTTGSKAMRIMGKFIKVTFFIKVFLYD